MPVCVKLFSFSHFHKNLKAKLEVGEILPVCFPGGTWIPTVSCPQSFRQQHTDVRGCLNLFSSWGGGGESQTVHSLCVFLLKNHLFLLYFFLQFIYATMLLLFFHFDSATSSMPCTTSLLSSLDRDV